MDTELSFVNLIDYFERRANHVERDASRYRHGDGPQRPPFFVFLGSNVEQVFAGVARELLDLWPQFGDAFRFVGADYGMEHVLCYWSLHLDSEGVSQSESISESGLLQEMSKLISCGSVFPRMTTVNLYYVINTSSIKAVEDFNALVEAVIHIQDVLQLDKTNSRCSLTVLLDSSLAKRVIAKQLRERITDLSLHMDDTPISSLFLLSNYRNDGLLLLSWKECYRIVSLYMALTNCADSAVINQLYDNRVLTASYAIVRKPIHDIGQVCLDALLRGVNTYGAPANRDLLNEDGVQSQLGVTNEGTFKVIDDNAARLAQEIVPTKKQLQYFPQDEYRDYSKLGSYTFSSFDEACMGALSVYLKTAQRTRLVVDDARRRAWAQAYGELLRNNFSIDELIYLGDHIQEVRSLFRQPARAPLAYGVIEGANDRLRRDLSQNEQVIELLIGQIAKESAKAQDFRALWHNLLGSLVMVREVKNETLITFYGRKTNQFLRLQGQNLGKKFAEQATTQDLITFLEGTIDKLIESDPVFSAPFDAELMQRLNVVNDGADWFEWIYSNLTGVHLKTYLQISFALDDPVAKAIFMEEGTDLRSRLQGALPSQTHFYNTGSGHWVEAINLHVVDVSNLT